MSGSFSSSDNSNDGDRPDSTSHTDSPTSPDADGAPPASPHSAGSGDHAVDKRPHSGDDTVQTHFPGGESDPDASEPKTMLISSDREGESEDSSDNEPANADDQRHSGHMKIPQEVVDDMCRCLEGLRQTLARGRGHASSDSVFDWNSRVKKFLEENLSHAKCVNSLK